MEFTRRLASATLIFTAGLLAAASALSTSARTAAWDEDLAIVRDEFLQRDRSYSDQTRREARAYIERLRSEIAELTDQQLVAGLARVAALSRNAHTRAYLLRNGSYWRRYPIRIWRFSDGWYVVAGKAEGTALVGGKLTHIGGVAVDEVFDKVSALFAGNIGWANYMASYSLTSPDALLGVGAVPNEVVEFATQVNGRARVARLRPLPLDKRTGPEESWWYLSPQHPAASGWTHALESRPLPEVLTSPGLNYTYARCERDLLYVRYNRSADAPGQETVNAFGERLLEAIAAQRPRKVLLDLRFNTGGNLQLAMPLLQSLARSPLGSEPGAIVVLVSGTTFSAGITSAAWLRANSKAILIGSHPGDGLDFWAEGGNVTLPNSGIVMHYANGLHQYSNAPVPEGMREHLPLGIDVHSLEPDIAAHWTWSDYMSGADPAATVAAGGDLRCD